MSLVGHAKRELELTGLLNAEKDFYGGMTGKAVLELIEVFSKQGHSGMSASLVADIFNKLARYEVISPLTGEDNEWNLISDEAETDGVEEYQNNRNSAVFKKGKEGRAYYLNAMVKKTQNGSTWSGAFWTSKEDYLANNKKNFFYSRAYIKEFPFSPKTFYIDVIEEEVKPNDWEMYVKDLQQLEEVKKYYDLYSVE